MGNCVRCMAYRKLYVKNRCYCCYQDDLVKLRLNEIEQGFSPVSDYNNDLWCLFIQYLRRYRLKYNHLKQAKQMANLLSHEPISTIHSWNQIYLLNSKYRFPECPGAKSHNNGCAWLKVGYMLQELNILGARSEEYQLQIQILLEGIDNNTADHLLRFMSILKKSGRTDVTITRYLSVIKYFAYWLREELSPPKTLLFADQMSIETYLERMKINNSYHTVVSNFKRLNAFYAWAKQTKLILINPCSSIKLSRPNQRLQICSEQEFGNLLAFVRNENSDSEQALAIVLVLFYGLRSEDLAYACLGVTSQILGPRAVPHNWTHGMSEVFSISYFS